MDAGEASQIGTGGGLRYLNEQPTADMVNREKAHSCQAACARQILRAAGVEVTESELLARIGYIEGYGTTAERTAAVLQELHPDLGFAGGAVDPEAGVRLFVRGPWIASLRTDRGTIHAVLADRLEEGIVEVRDPWGLAGPGSATGTRATILLSDFLEHWHWAINNAVFPNRSKSKE